MTPIYDIAIFGSTGFVGSRFIKYYAPYFKQRGLKVVVTARNLNKLKSVVENIHHLECLEVDVLNKENVFQIIKNSKIALNFAGPFDLYAENIIHGCAEYGVHYLDITGEVHFIKRMIALYSKKAEKSKAIIVPFSGFDSVPSDYAVYLAARKMLSQKSKLSSVDAIYRVKGGFNGGTIKTSFDMAEKLTSSEMKDRHYLRNSKPNYQRDANSPRYIPEIKQWVSPFFMEPINSKIVYRSIDLGGEDGFSEDFEYRESISIAKGKILNVFFSNISNLGNLLLSKKIFQSMATKFLPAPGEGPSEEQIETGKFQLRIIARSCDYHIFQFKMSSQGDPGNKSTIKFIGSSMKCLLDKKYGHRRGFLTPSTAFEENLLPYLNDEGITIQEY